MRTCRASYKGIYWSEFVHASTYSVVTGTRIPPFASCCSPPLSVLHFLFQFNFSKEKNTFEVVTPSRTFYIAADSEADLDDWIKAFNSVVRPTAQQVRFLIFKILQCFDSWMF